MSRPGNPDEHVRLSLGLYVLGALPRDDYVAISQHLAICSLCRDERDELAEVQALMALLSVADVDALTEELSGPKPSPLITARPGPAVPFRSKAHRRGHRAKPARPRVMVSLAAAAFLLVVALGTGVWLKVAEGSPPVAVTLAASGLDDATGASLFVELTARIGGASVRATVIGPRPGAKLQLFAVTVDGRSILVQQWAAAGGPQTIVGDLDATPGNIAFCVMAQMDGSVVVSVQLPGGSGS